MEDRSYDRLMSAHKDEIEVTTRRVRRRKWTPAEKFEIVRDSLVPGAVVSQVARRHDVSTSLIYTWRKALLGEAVGAFIPVALATPEGPFAAPTGPAEALSDTGPSAFGRIEILLPDGKRVSVEDGFGEAALVRVLRALAQA
ncbi:MAG: transposase [Alphaproteobacteria bacterium]|nr:transposase [Alphaproteobacteria bacterium]